MPILGTASLTLAPALALAQQSQTTDASVYKEAEDDDMVVQPFNLSVEELEEMDVQTADGEEVGEVEEVLVDGAGEPVAVAVEVGGFLGLGEREVAVGLDQLQLMEDHFVTDADAAALEAMPIWED